MTTAYIQKATIATPVSHIPDANQPAFALGESSAGSHSGAGVDAGRAGRHTHMNRVIAGA